MAKNGFRVLDSGIHIIEPPDLWARYMDARAVARFLELPLPDAAKRAILWDNCARYYGLT